MNEARSSEDRTIINKHRKEKNTNILKSQMQLTIYEGRRYIHNIHAA